MSFFGYSANAGSKITNGDLVPQALQLLNCQFPANQIERERQDASSGLVTSVYPAPNNTNDYMVGTGEILFSLRDSTDYGQHISARSALNGIPSAGSGDAQLKSLRDKIVILGLSEKTCTVHNNVISHTESPVAVVAGHMSMLNCSLFTTVVGDILIAVLPDPKRKQTQAPSDGSMAITSLRRIHEPVPLRMLVSPFLNGTSDAHLFESLFSPSIISSFFHHKHFKDFFIAACCHYTALNFNPTPRIPTPAKTAPIAEKKEATRKIAQRNFQAWSKNGNLYSVKPEQVYTKEAFDEYKETKKEFETEQLGEQMLCALVKNSDEAHPIMVDMMRYLIPLSCKLVSILLSNKVARVTRGSTPGKMQDVVVELSPFSMGKM
jgi:hypothetical protein